MASDRENDSNRDRKRETGDRKRTLGKGMTSPDSTQVPLKAETGEPDYDAIKGRIPPEDRGEDQRSSNR